MVSWRWLQPGLHLKRWVICISLGAILLILGAMALGVGVFDLHTMSPGEQEPTLSPYGLAGPLILVGAALVFTGIYRLVRRIEKLLKNQNESRGLAEIAYQRNRLEQGPRIVCLGGGTGLSSLLAGLKDYTDAITAIVSVADDGGSSGRLRKDLDMLPPGDIRNCLSALADAGPITAELMEYRFSDGELAGHSFGNLFLTVLTKIRGDFGQAVREANRILSVRGQVVPATLERVNLVAVHPDGTKTTGQRLIAACNKPISALSLKPDPGEPSPDMLEAIAQAELILIGPGSLYTSVLPNLLEPAVCKAISASAAQTMFIVNVMGQPGETAHFKVSDHLNALKKHAPDLQIDCALINSYQPSATKLEKLKENGIVLTEYDRQNTMPHNVRMILRDVINLDDPQHHDPRKLAGAIIDAFGELKKEG